MPASAGFVLLLMGTRAECLAERLIRPRMG
jgi:hypothetical protein